MINVYIDNKEYKITFDSYQSLLNHYGNRIIRILYLKDENKTDDEILKYIDLLVIDLHGCYILFSEDKFLKVITEVLGMKYNLTNENLRKYILDIANYLKRIELKGEEEYV